MSDNEYAVNYICGLKQLKSKPCLGAKYCQTHTLTLYSNPNFSLFEMTVPHLTV